MRLIYCRRTELWPNMAHYHDVSQRLKKSKQTLQGAAGLWADILYAGTD